MTLGRTATGKTSISQYFAKKLGLVYISEGNIKREILEKRKVYETDDSLDETLRDKGYTKAISKCVDFLRMGQSIIIDASFNKRYRREWLYDVIRKYNCCLTVFYTICSNLLIIENRITSRCTQSKEGNNHADSMAVYHHIDWYFDEPQEGEYDGVPTIVYYIDTHSNSIHDCKIFSGSPSYDKVLIKDSKVLVNYLKYMRINNDD